MQPRRQKVIGHSRLIQLQQQAVHIGLRGFSISALEREYASWIRHESKLPRQALMLVPFLAMVLAPFYGRMLLHPAEDVLLWLRLIEFGLAAPLCGFSILLLQRQPEARESTRVTFIAGIAVFWAVAAIRWVGASAGGTLSPEIVMVVPLALAAIGRFRLFLILPMVLACPLLFLLVEWQLNGGGKFASTVLGTVLFTALAVITAIATDRLSRRAWLSQGIVELTAMSDAVTGLPNRQWFNRDLVTLFALACRNREPLAVCIIDLDHFKKLNDTHGHAAGDAALTRVGELLARHGRRAMDLAGRFGGEEFVLVLHNPTFGGVQRIANTLLSEIREMGIENAKAPLGRVTASIGIYMAVPGLKDRPEDFLRLADVALYAAKQAGRDRYRLARPEDAVAAAPDAAEMEPIPVT